MGKETALYALAGVGSLVVASYAIRILRLCLGSLMGGIPLSKFAKPGAWAVVTGATAGIGFEFALQLAQAGFNVFLVSRDASKLEHTESKLASKVNVEIKTFAFDFQKATSSDYDTLKAQLMPLDVTVLVNNVGRSHDYPEYFASMPQEECDGILQINVNALVNMTRLVVPHMMSKKCGLILNIGSFSALVPSPLLSVYTGSKAFVHAFSQSLGSELEDFGITVSLINTYFVVSALSKIRKPSWLIPLPGPYVKSVLAHIGTPVGAVGDLPYVSTPYLPHALLQFFIDHVGTWPIVFWYNKRMHLDIRRRALNKKARAKAS